MLAHALLQDSGNRLTGLTYGALRTISVAERCDTYDHSMTKKEGGDLRRFAGARQQQAMARDDDGPDEKGERGGDTGETKQKGTGAKAEKGDQRHEDESRGRKGERPGGSSHGRPGSESGS